MRGLSEVAIAPTESPMACRPSSGAPVETEEALPELTVLMPCLNEARTLGACIAQAQRALQSHDINGEILVADNGSSDDSESARMASRSTGSDSTNLTVGVL